ncbi:PREDICTED: protein FAM133-like [Priapulus caudatus]|uniref:Protein FAM133-like n=1 Tax=Priapulus caudatus TaxID=37621 RepID=A0ABM1ECW3_PRICU|nr:PREDICTED: protein FAM133-like [Priapulus caudatus]
MTSEKVHKSKKHKKEKTDKVARTTLNLDNVDCNTDEVVPSATPKIKKRKVKVKLKGNECIEECSTTSASLNKHSEKRKKKIVKRRESDEEIASGKIAIVEAFENAREPTSKKHKKKRNKSSRAADDVNEASGLVSEPVLDENSQASKKCKKKKHSRGLMANCSAENLNISGKGDATSPKKDEDRNVDSTCVTASTNDVHSLTVVPENNTKKHKKRKHAEREVISSNSVPKCGELVESPKKKKKHKKQHHEEDEVEARDDSGLTTCSKGSPVSNTVKIKCAKEEAEVPPPLTTTNQWSTTGLLGGGDRQNKFLSLMGAFKSPNAGPKNVFAAGLRSTSSAMSKDKEEAFANAMSTHFEKTMGMQQDVRKGFGLGYQEPEGSNTKFHIDTSCVRSKKFN